MSPAAALEASVAAKQREQLLLGASPSYTLSMNQPGAQLTALHDAVRALNDGGYAYALIGGLAVGIHSGIPRATLDVDMAVLSSIDVETLAKHMQSHGFQETGRYPHSINFRHGSGEPVQLAFDGAFDPMVERAEAFVSRGAEVRIVTREDLIQMKSIAASDPRRRRSKVLRDQADIALLEEEAPDPDEGW